MNVQPQLKGLLSLLAICILFAMTLAAPARAGGNPLPTSLTPEQQNLWGKVWEEHQANKLILEFSQSYRPRTTALIDVNVIPMTTDDVLHGYTVIVRDGKISEIGPKEDVKIPDGATIIVAGEHYLVPGLTEGHAHTISSQSQYLVYLTRGITTVREMDGYPWMLKARAMAADNHLLVPNLYLTGHILSHFAWDFYMTQVDTPEQARRFVKEQAEAGYDFIKIHNSMPVPLFSALFEAAKEEGLDVVGHIPNEITIKHAIEMGMRTNEHFKGYIFDENLSITEQDYVGDTAGSDLWNAPSFANSLNHLRGDQVFPLVAAEDSMKFVPRWMRKSWLEEAGQPIDKLTELRQTILPKSAQIFKNLLPVTDKFFAGTDTGEYSMMVPGFTLQREVRFFEEFGLSPYEALKTATVNAALAMRKEAEYGTIETGKRADLLLLSKNPLDGAENLAAIDGVMVRGIYLDDVALAAIRECLESTFSEDNEIPDISYGQLQQLVAEMEEMSAQGYPHAGYVLENLQKFLNEIGRKALAKRVAALN